MKLEGQLRVTSYGLRVPRYLLGGTPERSSSREYQHPRPAPGPTVRAMPTYMLAIAYLGYVAGAAAAIVSDRRRVTPALVVQVLLAWHRP